MPATHRLSAATTRVTTVQALRAALATALIAILMLAGTAGPAPAADTNDPLRAVVKITAEVPPDARTARGLGTERTGSGVVIDSNGLILTIGYLVVEAMSVLVEGADGRTLPAEVVAYDYDTGFGLLRAARPLDVKPMALGDSSKLKADDPVLVVDFSGSAQAVGAHVVSRREFAGYWEYLIDEAIFTAPPHPNWGGAALVGSDGRLQGVGSLLVNDARGGRQFQPGNMFVPIDILKPVFADLLAEGRASAPQRPWIGLFAAEQENRVIVTYVNPDGPGAKAGLKPGDLIAGIGDAPIRSVAEFYRTLWRQGPAGVVVPLRILRDGDALDIAVPTGNRYQYLQLRRTY